MRIKVNDDNGHKYCCYCKEKIREGQKYAIVEEDLYNDEKIEKDYHITCVQPEEGDDEPYLTEQDDLNTLLDKFCNSEEIKENEDDD